MFLLASLVTVVVVSTASSLASIVHGPVGSIIPGEFLGEAFAVDCKTHVLANLCEQEVLVRSVSRSRWMVTFYKFKRCEDKKEKGDGGESVPCISSQGNFASGLR